MQKRYAIFELVASGEIHQGETCRLLRFIVSQPTRAEAEALVAKWVAREKRPTWYFVLEEIVAQKPDPPELKVSPDTIRDYIDGRIRHWRERESNVVNHYSLTVLQDMRCHLFGERLPPSVGRED